MRADETSSLIPSSSIQTLLKFYLYYVSRTPTVTLPFFADATTLCCCDALMVTCVCFLCTVLYCIQDGKTPDPFVTYYVQLIHLETEVIYCSVSLMRYFGCPILCCCCVTMPCHAHSLLREKC